MPTLIRRINPNFGSAFENDPLRLVRDLLRWDGFAEPEAPPISGIARCIWRRATRSLSSLPTPTNQRTFQHPRHRHRHLH